MRERERETEREREGERGSSYTPTSLNIDAGQFMVVVLLSLAWGWRTVMSQFSGFCCILGRCGHDIIDYNCNPGDPSMSIIPSLGPQGYEYKCYLLWAVWICRGN